MEESCTFAFNRAKQGQNIGSKDLGPRRDRAISRLAAAVNILVKLGTRSPRTHRPVELPRQLLPKLRPKLRPRIRGGEAELRAWDGGGELRGMVQ
jgi:hypothetical protein